MAFSIAQTVGKNNGSSTSTPNVVVAAVTQGHLTEVFFSWYPAAGSEVTSITDDVGNTYTLLDFVRESGTGVSMQSAYCFNAIGGATTITMNLTTARSPIEGMFTERIGAAGSSIDGHSAQAQATPGTGANAISSGNFTPATNNDLIVGYVGQDAGSGNISAGTNFTERLELSSNFPGISVEDRVLATAATVASTFTQGTASATATNGFAWTPGAYVFGDQMGSLTGTTLSATNPTSATGSVVVAVGDLIAASVSERPNLTVTAMADNLGNTYNAWNAGTDSGNATGRSFYARVTNAGTLTQIDATMTASTDDTCVGAVCIQGPFVVSPLDANPANVQDIATPYTAPATGTLSQNDEVVVSTMATANGITNLVATAPSILAFSIGTGANNGNGTAGLSISTRRVSSTTSVAPAWTGTAPGSSVLCTASFKKDLTAGVTYFDMVVEDYAWQILYRPEMVGY